jgi:hypothetical protein
MHPTDLSTDFFSVGGAKAHCWERQFVTAINEINHLVQTVDQEVGGSSPPSCTNDLGQNSKAPFWPRQASSSAQTLARHTWAARCEGRTWRRRGRQGADADRPASRNGHRNPPLIADAARGRRRNGMHQAGEAQLSIDFACGSNPNFKPFPEGDYQPKAQFLTAE